MVLLQLATASLEPGRTAVARLSLLYSVRAVLPTRVETGIADSLVVDSMVVGSVCEAEIPSPVGADRN